MRVYWYVVHLAFSAHTLLVLLLKTSLCLSSVFSLSFTQILLKETKFLSLWILTANVGKDLSTDSKEIKHLLVMDVQL